MDLPDRYRMQLCSSLLAEASCNLRGKTGFSNLTWMYRAMAGVLVSSSCVDISTGSCCCVEDIAVGQHHGEPFSPPLSGCNAPGALSVLVAKQQPMVVLGCWLLSGLRALPHNSSTRVAEKGELL